MNNSVGRNYTATSYYFFVPAVLLLRGKVKSALAAAATVVVDGSLEQLYSARQR